MTDFQTGIITLMKCAITGERAQLPDGFSMEEAETFAVKQNITTLIYEGAVICGISPKEPVMQRMFQRYVQLMMHSERQLMEAERIFKAFDENGIDYLPLKGCNMKNLYPKPELRYMGDADILIRTEQYDQIRCIMTELGFSEHKKNDCDYHYHWSNAHLHVELHKSLLSSTNKQLYDYWGIGWNRAKITSGSHFTMCVEDDYLFLLTHFAKHYIGPGIGCRYLLDLWLFLHSYRNLDQFYLEEELSKLHLLAFYQNLRKLIQVWFENAETDDRSDCMTDFLFSGSSWGNWKNGQLSSVVKKTKNHSYNKITLMWWKLFPSLPSMTCRYPILRKYSILLPLCWFWRIMCALLVDPRKRKISMHFLANVTSESIADYKHNLQYVGLYFEEE